MSEREILKIFESIPQNETYSKYYTSLEKLFKTQSLRHFVNIYKQKKELSYDKKSSKDYTTNVFWEEMNNKRINEDDEIDIFDNNNEEKENDKKENLKEDSSLEFLKQMFETKRKKIGQNLDPFKYHPNYNSIYKNIPSVRMKEPKKTNIIEKNKGKKLINSKENIRANKLLLTEVNTISNILGKNKQKGEQNNINKTAENINQHKLPKLTKINNNNKYQNRNNHAIRFSKYLPRKFIIPEINKNISYINPFNYPIPKNRNRSIDFEKMSYRNGKTLVYVSSLKIPSFGQYNPKYNWIDKDKNIISFNHDEKDEKKYKKYLIKKLWTSYKVNTEYQMIDNDKLKKTKYNCK